ncbi:hypothetical protein BB559_004312 [Furculomyces boomerangus]|nr:hypothetical protein BB559_004312 [Furculomyces boomerangus]PVZ98939.1 hypothetical protein BB558_005077 [Smittium angustum]
MSLNSSSIKGFASAIPKSTRGPLKLDGLMPTGVDTYKQLELKAINQLQKISSPVDKYMFLSMLRNNNPSLFYRIVLDNIREVAPIIYTPTIGHVCLAFSDLYPFMSPPGKVNGLYISLDQLDRIDEVIQNYKVAADSENNPPEISVITDGSRILGLGDLGVNGMGIPIGKLQLYVAGAGLNPKRCLPIVVDFGTDNEEFLKDPNYLGLRRKRPDDKTFYDGMEKVLSSLVKAFPKMFIQFEDFSTDHAFGLLEKYRYKLTCFNDDIQGTGAVIMSGFMKAISLSGIPAENHRILFCGAGSAGIGVADKLIDCLVIYHGMTTEQARKLFWLVDSKGLITSNRGDKLSSHKEPYARHDNGNAQCKDLLEAVNFVKPTVLIGLSTVKGQFSNQILTRLSEINSKNRPIVFPLSNPETKAECTFEEAMVATQNRVLFASGTAFPPYKIPGTNDIRIPGQGNNMYVFPAIGLGAVLAKPKYITDTIICAVSKALSDSLTESEIEAGDLYPRIERLREVSAELTAAFIHQSVAEGLAQDTQWVERVKNSDTNGMLEKNKEKPTGYFSPDIVKAVKEQMWSPIDTIPLKSNI